MRIAYETDSTETYYSMIFTTKDDLKLFLRACEDQKLANESAKTTLYKGLEERFKK